MTRHLLKLAPWACLAAILFVTVSPISLRPGDILPVDLDRALAFTLLGVLFVLAYPRHILLCAVLLVLGAGVIETLQFLSPTRHAHWEDAAVKAAGAAIGVLIGRFALRFHPDMRARARIQPAE